MNKCIFAVISLFACVATVADTGNATTFPEWTKTLKGSGGSPKWITGKVGGFSADYQSRIVANPGDCEARLLHAATLIASLGENETMKEYLKAFGFEIDYLGLQLSGSERDTSAWPAMNEIVDAMVAQCAPVLQMALDDLKSIPNGWTGDVHLDSAVWPIDEDVYVDIADVLYARAGLESILGSIYYLKGYDLTVDWVKARNLNKQKIPVLSSAPSLEGDDGWASALTWRLVDYDGQDPESAVQIAFVGKNLYLRINDALGYDDVDSLDYVSISGSAGNRDIRIEQQWGGGGFTVNNGTSPRPVWTENMDWTEYNELNTLYCANNVSCPAVISKIANSIIVKIDVSGGGIDNDIGEMALDHVSVSLRRPNRPHYQWGMLSDYYSYSCDGKPSWAP